MNVYEGYITVDVPVRYYAQNEERGKEQFSLDCRFLEKTKIPCGCIIAMRPSILKTRWEDLELVGRETF